MALDEIEIADGCYSATSLIQNQVFEGFFFDDHFSLWQVGSDDVAPWGRCEPRG